MKIDMMKLVTFQLGDELFAADIYSVERVLRYATPSAVPDAPEWVEGVIENGGQVIPVVDLRRRIELAEHAVTATTRILVLGTSDGAIGAIVDAVLEVAVVPIASVSPPPPLFRGLSSRFISGVAKIRGRLTVVLDVDRIVTSSDRLHFDATVDATRDSATEPLARG